ncbi:hypothetical protein THRCLA_00813 [Thraustotheca clavata]|uniref:Uncharacterized protein n=1 Tax=Thraustotheca clavata TaxID=74557 RepID=A0A1W0AA57_9STRA|nr:hypothetical protein THRCLA_00813 [Thraustotheca clavata]
MLTIFIELTLFNYPSVQNFTLDYLLHQMLASNAWNLKGVCQYGVFLGMNVGQECIWLETLDSGIFILSYIFQLPHFYYWLWCKWTKYYRHCLALFTTVQNHGHQLNCLANTSYELFIGNPTPLILIKPYSFTLDIRLSITSKLLKYLQKEYLFHDVDPTIVAICVALYIIPADFTQANTIVVDAYFYLFQIPLSPDVQDEQQDVLFGCILLSLNK